MSTTAAPAPTLAPQASVVIPTYQRRERLRAALAALARQTLPPHAFEVIVSIDGSSDGSREMAESYAAPFPLRVVYGPNRGRAAACNAGIAAARGEVVVLLDDDMAPAPDWLRAHLRAHAGGERRAVIGAVPIALAADASATATFMARRFGDHQRRLSTPGYVVQLNDFYSGNLSARRDDLRDVGAFDDRFTTYGNEDIELAVRLTRAGVRLAYDAEALAWQSYDKDVTARARDAEADGRNAVALVRLHPDAAPALILGHRQPLLRRAAVATLFTLTRLWPATPERLVDVLTWLGRHRPPQWQRLWWIAFDYYYWRGVRQARARALPFDHQDGPR